MKQRIGQLVNVATVRDDARAKWEQEQLQRATTQERVGTSIPWWLIVIAVGVLILSAPHTITVFNLVTPYKLGVVAPVVVEFTLLFYAFRKTQDRQEGRKSSWHLNATGVMAFTISFVANGVGSLTTLVAHSQNIEDMPVSELASQITKMPAGDQAGLLLVPVVAFVIPILNLVVGEGLAKLFFEQRAQGRPIDLQWDAVRDKVEYEALLDAALAAGATAIQATRWAQTVAGVGDTRAQSPQRPVSAGVRYGQTDSDADDFADGLSEDDGRAYGHGHGQGYARTMDARTRVKAHLADNPDDAELSVRALADVAGVGKTVAAEVLSEYKSSRNGHGHKHDEN